jgi:biotin carboxyl carrier protein
MKPSLCGAFILFYFFGITNITIAICLYLQIGKVQQQQQQQHQQQLHQQQQQVAAAQAAVNAAAAAAAILPRFPQIGTVPMSVPMSIPMSVAMPQTSGITLMTQMPGTLLRPAMALPPTTIMSPAAAAAANMNMLRPSPVGFPGENSMKWFL